MNTCVGLKWRLGIYFSMLKTNLTKNKLKYTNKIIKSNKEKEKMYKNGEANSQDM